MHLLLNFVVEDVLEHLLKYFSLPCMSQNLSSGPGRNITTLITVPQSQGDPQILKRGPNFEQKGDQEGTQNSIFSFTQS